MMFQHFQESAHDGPVPKMVHGIFSIYGSIRVYLAHPTKFLLKKKLSEWVAYRVLEV